jgi:RNase H-fold protein (predicted Holliday junction resolvase)
LLGSEVFGFDLGTLEIGSAVGAQIERLAAHIVNARWLVVCGEKSVTAISASEFGKSRQLLV